MAARPPPGKPPVGKQPPIPPNQTLYVTNLLSSKIQKDDLKTALYMLFSTYGPVLDVVVLKTVKMRGQAHVVFRDIQAATQALRSLEGYDFLGKQLRIQYAKSKSDVVAKLDGTYKMPGTSGANANVEMTETQHNIFNAPAPGTTSTAAPAPARGLPAKPPSSGSPAPAADGRGQKRTRDEEDEDESDEDVAMEEDSDDE
ncbi:hypothetical protein JX265_005492 [Neoarthrinium moseri]|uniref:RRM domain-containing protein n=1 Tax=Neoarthrinium moseri TaxID=1658444 RepID=A0A9P9WPE4_9PEZI|nr:uncharacterized protein JN550_009290 [Neoarthrinium moseri]KAI1863792.1 hypothetical protein JN550_009290 [Neoarthrinium moseri]KAI1872612.1 hypothetical protein JX265_005492 [Neoarthrinium moseri]